MVIVSPYLLSILPSTSSVGKRRYSCACVRRFISRSRLRFCKASKNSTGILARS
jgi:hypothetical protein